MSDHHPACPGGCGELADECACPDPSPLGSVRVEERMASGLPESWWADEEEAAQ